MRKCIPLGRIGNPVKVGDLKVFLAPGGASHMTSQAINIIGGQLLEV